MKNYIILGQGIAGSVLALEMIRRGLNFKVIDHPQLSSSSKIAAGLVNPIVLKRLKMVADAEKHLQHAENFYTHWQKQLHSEFYHKISISHFFSKQENQNEWMEKSAYPPFSNYLGEVIAKSPSNFKGDFVFGKMKNTAWLNSSKFLALVREFLQNNGQLISSEIKLEDLQKDYPMEDIIICNGHLLRHHPRFKEVFAATRGELLTIRTTEIPQEQIFHAGVFILPIGKNLFKVGASYHWDDLKDQGTEEGRKKLIYELEKMFSGNYEIIDHQAGIRPNIKDRKPILGTSENWHVFNGLGSRGVLMAPYLATVMLDYLQGQGEIPAEYNIHRFGI